jgi:ribosomal protein S18 acetylase RimI-like enzyme
MTIRILTADDAAIHRELRLFALREHPTAFGSSYEEEVNRSLSVTASRLSPPDSDNFTLGAFVGDKLVGTVGLGTNRRPKMGHIGIIWGMYVHPDARGQGLGRALMQATIQRARHIGRLEQIKLSVVTTNVAALSLYESLGFETYGTEYRALLVDGIYYDEYHMWLRLNTDTI